VRTDRWKYIHYPHGDGKADRHLAELYDLKTDPEERHNLIGDPKNADRITELLAELSRQMKLTGLDKDLMPIDEGIKAALPDPKIR
jgi:arylsulfatase A-like enzyme